MEQKTAQFQIQDMLPIALTLVVVGIGVSYGINVVSDVRGDFTANTSEYNATDKTMEGLGKLPEKLPLIATVLVAAIIIGILVRYLFMRFS
jgi:hypothetical protein|tara:strand:+ start:89 stop:361 length:273 start_codon:yes stop_codon:yes gene_type:complete